MEIKIGVTRNIRTGEIDVPVVTHCCVCGEPLAIFVQGRPYKPTDLPMVTCHNTNGCWMVGQTVSGIPGNYYIERFDEYKKSYYANLAKHGGAA